MFLIVCGLDFTTLGSYQGFLIFYRQNHKVNCRNLMFMLQIIYQKHVLAYIWLANTVPCWMTPHCSKSLARFTVFAKWPCRKVDYAEGTVWYDPVHIEPIFLFHQWHLVAVQIYCKSKADHSCCCLWRSKIQMALQPLSGLWGGVWD